MASGTRASAPGRRASDKKGAGPAGTGRDTPAPDAVTAEDSSDGTKPRRAVVLNFIGQVVSTAILVVLALVNLGAIAFKTALVDSSIFFFDAAERSGFPSALLWQRGISLYYAGRFEEGATQFRGDLELNPNDTEEAIWTVLCEAQVYGLVEAQRRMPVVAGDPRTVMRTVYKMFRGGTSELREDYELILRRIADGQGVESDSDTFYAALYLGLFAEAGRRTEEAKRFILLATRSSYGRSSFDFMTDVARVHAHLRGWDQDKTAS